MIFNSSETSIIARVSVQTVCITPHLGLSDDGISPMRAAVQLTALRRYPCEGAGLRCADCAAQKGSAERGCLYQQTGQCLSLREAVGNFER